MTNTMQAIRLMQNLGLANMGAYPYVRAAIIGQSINSFETSK